MKNAGMIPWSPTDSDNSFADSESKNQEEMVVQTESSCGSSDTIRETDEIDGICDTECNEDDISKSFDMKEHIHESIR